ncbi:unnamed protein product, partial [Rotaria sp. Silwood2]
SEALIELLNNLPNDFSKVVEHIINFKGRIILTGIGEDKMAEEELGGNISTNMYNISLKDKAQLITAGKLRSIPLGAPNSSIPSPSRKNSSERSGPSTSG